MRHPNSFTYRIAQLPPVPPVLSFIQRHAQSDAREAYGNLNMGAGFALFVAAGDAARVVDVSARAGVRAWIAGRVESGAKQVVIEPLDLVFSGDDLHVRA